MKVRLLDSSLADIKSTLDQLGKKILNGEIKGINKKKKLSEIPLRIVFHRGTIDLENNEWSKSKTLAENLSMDNAIISKALSEKNLNMGILGYGDPKGGLKSLLKWVKHNVTLEKIKGDKRDLNIKIEHLKRDPKHKGGVLLELRVPEKGASPSEDLKNVKLEQDGYIGLKKWTEEQLEKIKDSKEKLDKVLYNVLTGKAKLEDKVKEVVD